MNEAATLSYPQIHLYFQIFSLSFTLCRRAHPITQHLDEKEILCRMHILQYTGSSDPDISVHNTRTGTKFKISLNHFIRSIPNVILEVDEPKRLMRRTDVQSRFSYSTGLEGSFLA